jgi:hypothetical protein
MKSEIKTDYYSVNFNLASLHFYDLFFMDQSPS